MIEWSIRMGAASQIPKPVAAAIKKCWPDGVVAEFETDESYFLEIHPRLERDLRNIRGSRASVADRRAGERRQLG